MKECTGSEMFGPSVYYCMLTTDNLIEIQVLYGVLVEFDLELPNSDAWVNDSPSGRLGVYIKAFEARIKFHIPPFLFDLFRFYNISLYTLTPNSLRLMLGFLVIYFLAKVQLLVILFHAFYTIKRYTYAKD